MVKMVHYHEDLSSSTVQIMVVGDTVLGLCVTLS